MKKIFKSRIFTLLMGAFIVVGIDAIADTTLIAGNKISYSNSTSRLSSTNMQGAMDELYQKAKHSETYTYPANSTGGTVDLQEFHHYRYVNAENVYSKGKNDGTSATKVGTATAAQVLTGYTFTNASSVGASGTMPNRGELNWKPSIGTTKTVQAGYYSGGTLDSRDAYNNGYNAGVAAGKTTHTDNYVLSATELTKDFGIYHSYKSVDATNVYNAGFAAGKAASPSEISASYSFGSEYRDVTFYDWVCPVNGTVKVLTMNAELTNNCSGSDAKIEFYVGDTRILFDDVKNGCDDATSSTRNESGSWPCSAGQHVYGKVWVGGGIEQYSQIHGSVGVFGLFNPS